MWSRFLNLPSSTRSLLFEALIALAWARMALWVHHLMRVPFSRFRRRRIATSPDADSSKIAWSVDVVSRFVPRSTCLVRALAAQHLLARHGYASDLHIGVANSAVSGFEAHAWVECDGSVLVGHTRMQYTTLLNWSATP